MKINKDLKMGPATIPISLNEYTSSLFPKEISLSYKDPYTKKTIKEGLIESIAHKIPYYALSIAEIKGHSGSDSKYEIFEACPLYIHLLSCVDNNEKFTSPFNKTYEISSVHYFALSCLKFDQQQLFKPIQLGDDDLLFVPFEFQTPFPRKSNETLEDSIEEKETILVDSLNYHSLGNENPLETAGRFKYLADAIEANEIFSTLKAKEREIEVLKWIWRATQTAIPSCQHLLNLAAKYISIFETTHSSEDVRKVALEIIKKTPAENTISIEDKKAYEHICSMLEILSNPNTVATLDT